MRSRAAIAIVGLWAASACRSEPIARTHPPSASPPVSARRAQSAPGVFDCGSERSAHGQGVNVAARQCFARAYRDGRPARVSITLHTIEGDPLRYDLTATSKRNVEVVHESQDRFGSPGTSRFSCRSLEPLNDGGSTLTLRGCQGGSDELTIP
jgi:hypothetical protein